MPLIFSVDPRHHALSCTLGLMLYSLRTGAHEEGLRLKTYLLVSIDTEDLPKSHMLCLW